jgi:recombinational DNA repair protein RecT
MSQELTITNSNLAEIYDKNSKNFQTLWMSATNLNEKKAELSVQRELINIQNSLIGVSYTPKALYEFLINAFASGLNVSDDQIYPVPFKSGNSMDIKPIIGYKGKIKMLSRAGYTDIYCSAVYDCDHIEFVGIPPKPTKETKFVMPRPEGAKICGAVFYCKTPTGSEFYHYMDTEMVMEHMKHSKVKDKQGNPKGIWETNPAAAYRKTVVHGAFTLLYHQGNDSLLPEHVNPSAIVDTQQTVDTTYQEANAEPTHLTGNEAGF